MLAHKDTHDILAGVQSLDVLRELHNLQNPGQWIDGVPEWAQQISDIVGGGIPDGPFHEPFNFMFVRDEMQRWLIDIAYEY